MQDRREVPSVTKIEEALARASKHADISAATPTDIAGRPAYTVRISPREHPGLIGGAELSFDAEQGIPLRGAVYAKGASAAALELVASEISYEAVPASTFELTPAPGMQVKEIEPHKEGAASGSKGGDETQPKVSHHGLGLESIAVIESHPKPGQNPSANLPEGLQKVKINGITASELPTALGTLLTFERAGVNYVLVGSVTPEAIESLARGL
jgi:hypothetical protein